MFFITSDHVLNQHSFQIQKNYMGDGLLLHIRKDISYENPFT